MTLSYNIGLTAGSLMSYILDDMLGPPVPNGCTIMPPIIKMATAATKLNATAVAANQFAPIGPTNASITSRLSPNILVSSTTVPSTIAMVAATVMTAATVATSTMSSVSVQSPATAVASTASHFLKTIQPLANATAH